MGWNHWCVHDEHTFRRVVERGMYVSLSIYIYNHLFILSALFCFVEYFWICLCVYIVQKALLFISIFFSFWFVYNENEFKMVEVRGWRLLRSFVTCLLNQMWMSQRAGGASYVTRDSMEVYVQCIVNSVILNSFFWGFLSRRNDWLKIILSIC